MNSVLVIVDSHTQWAPYYQTESIVTVLDYLQSKGQEHQTHLVINLCSDLSYHSLGYYCSLLAQARKHRVIPTIETLNRLDSDTSVKLDSSLLRLCRCHDNLPTESTDGEFHLDIFFGKCEDPRLERLARFIFDQYPAPMLRATFNGSEQAKITQIRPLTLDELSDAQEDIFANTLDQFNRKIWRQPRSKKAARYDLAILHDPEELFPPSNKTALNIFVNEAKKMNIHAEMITEMDSSRLMEFDALFIRQTTAVNHITYRLAQAAKQADMVVIDDPSSIIRCSNKVFLKELMDRTSIAAPESRLLFKTSYPDYEQLAAEIGPTMVIKIPDGSFSVGVSKVANAREYEDLLAALFQRTSILLAQKFMPTEFDWRIGVLNGDCIYACKYFMAHGHWQIYQHKAGAAVRSGKAETVPVHTVPKQVTRLATKVSGAVGKGLYGVDIKLIDNNAMVIEVNDNPSIDHGIEDKILGNELYRIILREFADRLGQKNRS